jgi:hypothetical protein
MELKKKVAGVGTGILAAAGIVYLKSGTDGSKKFETFESKEGRFTVSMPPNPDKLTQKVKSEEGDISFTMFVADSLEYGFVVGYSDYSKEFIETSDPMENLGWIIDGVVAGVKGKLVKEKVLEIAAAAKEYRVDVPEKGTLTSRLILDGTRLYQLIAMYPVDGQDEKKTAIFFESFKINNE